MLFVSIPEFMWLCCLSPPHVQVEEEEEAAREELWRDELRKEIEERMSEVKEKEEELQKV